MTQINPPFDASAPCPGCQQEPRAIAALIHNFLNRCDVTASSIREGKAMVRLNDLRKMTFPDTLTVPHPDAEEIVAVGRALADACAGMTEEGLRILWTPDVIEGVEALIPRAAAASDAYARLSDAHFADQRHCRGEPNVLREARGSRFAGHVARDHDSAAYDYTVEVVEADGDMLHLVCGTHLKLHDNFKDQLALDPHFYGKVYCPTCRANVPSEQFSVSADVLLPGG